MNITEVQDVPVESSPTAAAETTEPQGIRLEQMSPEQRNEFMRTGKIPTAAEPEPSASSSDAVVEPTDEIPAPASEPGKPQEPQKPRETAAQKRIRELVSRVKELEAQAAQPARPDVKPPEAPSAPKPAETPKPTQPSQLLRPTKPQLKDFDDYEKYEAAHDKYVEDLADYKAQTRLQEAREQAVASQRAQAVQQANREIESQWAKQIEQGREAHEDYDQVISEAAKHIQRGTVIDGYILQSGVGGELLYRLGSDVKTLKRIAAMNPVQAMEALVSLKLEIGGKPAAPAEAPPPRISRTPAPSTDLGARNSAPADDVMGAVSSRDPGAYIRLMNARDAARK